jgi:bifunctional UDP-N-acetylglucosamine pyrophosphorylase/glucosamine-1-phosphate N-acetyltransferase
MRSRLPKVLHPLAGRPMLLHLAATLATLPDVTPLFVLGHEFAQVRAVLDPAALWILQAEQRGTGHAVVTALPAVPPAARRLLIVYGDVPLLRAATLRDLFAAHDARGAALSLLTATVDDPTGYGRIVRDSHSGAVTRIAEQRELAAGEEAIHEINAGIYCVDALWLRRALAGLAVHPDGELYLTDLVETAVRAGLGVHACHLASPVEVTGINTRVQLAAAEAAMRLRINEELMLAGVTMIDTAATYVDAGVRIGPDTVLYPHTFLRGETVIGPECQIGPGTTIVSSRVGAGCRISSSVVEEALVGDGVTIGPFAHLRPGARLDDGVHVGNYAEVKNARLGPHTKMPHASYVGDATVGAGVNIGAASVVCNYDGRKKHHTTIEDGVFVGSGTLLRAPVRLGARSATGAGAVVLHDVAPGVTVAGVPARPISGRRAGTPHAPSGEESIAPGEGEQTAAEPAPDQQPGR